MISLPTSSDSDSVDSRDTQEWEIEYYREIYGSDAAKKCTEEKRDWAISAQRELKTLRKEHGEAKDLAEFLSEQDVNQQIALRKCVAENGKLKRRLKWQQDFSTMASVVLLIAVAWRLWFGH